MKIQLNILPAGGRMVRATLIKLVIVGSTLVGFMTGGVFKRVRFPQDLNLAAVVGSCSPQFPP